MIQDQLAPLLVKLAALLIHAAEIVEQRALGPQPDGAAQVCGRGVVGTGRLDMQHTDRGIEPPACPGRMGKDAVRVDRAIDTGQDKFG